MPDTPRLRMTNKEHVPHQIASDFDWIRAHKQELREKYGECSIIVYRKCVIGVGKTYKEALENAEQNLSPEMTEVITPIHQLLRNQVHFSGYLRARCD